MARTTFNRYFETTIPAATVGADPAGVLRAEIQTRLQAIQTNGVNAWETWQTGLSGGNYFPGYTSVSGDIYRSLGDRTLNSGAGDAGIFMGIDAQTATALRFFVAHDYATTGAGTRFASASGLHTLSSLQTSTDMFVAGAVNEYEFVFIVNQGAQWKQLFGGSLLRTHVPGGHSGVAFTTAALTGGGGAQTVTLDRDLAGNLQVGQPVWVYNQTPAGTARRATDIESVTVTAVGSSTVTVSPTSSFDSGAILGLDPCPVYMGHLVGTYNFTNRGDGTLNAGSGSPRPMSAVASNHNPDQSGFHTVTRVQVSGPALNDQSRGTASLLGMATTYGVGANRPTDTVRADFNSSLQFAPFAALGQPYSTWSICIGPYSTVGS